MHSSGIYHLASTRIIVLLLVNNISLKLDIAVYGFSNDFECVMITGMCNDFEFY